MLFSEQRRGRQRLGGGAGEARGVRLGAARVLRGVQEVQAVIHLWCHGRWYTRWYMGNTWCCTRWYTCGATGGGTHVGTWGTHGAARGGTPVVPRAVVHTLDHVYHHGAARSGTPSVLCAVVHTLVQWYTWCCARWYTCGATGGGTHVGTCSTHGAARGGTPLVLCAVVHTLVHWYTWCYSYMRWCTPTCLPELGLFGFLGLKNAPLYWKSIEMLAKWKTKPCHNCSNSLRWDVNSNWMSKTQFCSTG